jgi:hypothetical protein
VWAFLGPFLPMLTNTEENLDALFSAAARLPLSHIHTDRVNFRSARGSPTRWRGTACPGRCAEDAEPLFSVAPPLHVRGALVEADGLQE